MKNTEIIFGVFFILFGLCFVIFHSKLNQFAINRWYRKFPNIKIWEKGYEIFFLMSGAVFIIFGLLLLFKIIRFR